MLRQNGRALNDGRFAPIECQHDADDDHGAKDALLKLGINLYHVHPVIRHAEQKPAEQRVNRSAGSPVSAVPPTTTAAIDFKT